LVTIDALGALQKCVMETIWELGEATVGQVRDRRQREPQPAYTTILSVMQKLEDVYHKSRPTLRVEPGKVLELDDHVGLHPSLKDLHRLWETGELAVVQGVVYPDPNRSHFRSMEIWQTGTVGPAPPAGWPGRLGDAPPRWSSAMSGRGRCRWPCRGGRWWLSRWPALPRITPARRIITNG